MNELATDVLQAVKDPAGKKALLGVFSEIADHMNTMQDLRIQIDEVLVDAVKKFNIKKPLLRKVSRLYWKKHGTEFQAECAEIKALYDTVMTVTPK
jgi:hypothetical protein